MSRTKLARSVVDTCADCGAVDPTWASINKGILICDECCSVHRTLGRHISHVKSLRKGSWVPSQLAMVHALHSNGANSIWEHTLLDPTNSRSGRKKPQARDPVKPTKSDFIRTKHQMLGFVHRGSGNATANHNNNNNTNAKQGSSSDEKMADLSSVEGTGPDTIAAIDASKQLHSSVRTANLETSLRLLSYGADPNYLHPEKGTCPLHVAAGAGQASQVELLLVYGADPGSLDTQHKTPIDHASESGYKDIAYRLLESQYELTDRLSSYLCERKPDHASGQHFLIPEMADSLESNSEAAKTAKRKLQMLPNYLFEEMAMDAYDEVDRRESEQFWLCLQPANAANQTSVPFLPAHPELSASRNQARQKLGRLNPREFTTLLIDLLCEAKRRHLGTHLAIRGDSRMVFGREHADYDEPLYDSVASEASEDEFAGLAAGQLRTPQQPGVTVEAYRDITEQLSLSNRRMQELLVSNAGMQSQIGQLQSMVQSLVQENKTLKASTTTATAAQPLLSNPVMAPASNGPVFKSLHISQEEPALGTSGSSVGANGGVLLRPGNKLIMDRQNCRSMFEPREVPRKPQEQRPTLGPSLLSPSGPPLSPAQLTEEVIRRTNGITRRIQEVFRAVQERRLQDQVEPAANRTLEAVESVVAVIPLSASEEIRSCLQQLSGSAARLQTECKEAATVGSASPDLTTATQRIIQGAYDVAKATKQLVTLYQ